MQISFGANLISTTTVDKLTNISKGTFRKVPVSFVEFDPTNSCDMRAINGIANLYNSSDIPNHNNYAEQIRGEFNTIFINRNNLKQRRFFGLTTQSTGFNYIDVPKTLGVASTSIIDNAVNINFLQVDPTQNFFARDRKIYGVGTSILNSLKALFKDNDLCLLPDYDAVKFYTLNGFKPVKKGQRSLIFKH